MFIRANLHQCSAVQGNKKGEPEESYFLVRGLVHSFSHPSTSPSTIRKSGCSTSVFTSQSAKYFFPIALPELAPEMQQLVASLSNRDGDFANCKSAPDFSSFKCVASLCCFIQKFAQVRVNCVIRSWMCAKAFKLRMMQVPFRATAEHMCASPAVTPLGVTRGTIPQNKTRLRFATAGKQVTPENSGEATASFCIEA
jgi:hypothetical protein